MSRRAVIIGAGPAGLTAGLELLRRSDVKPIILEASDEIGGISRTIKYKGNRMDIGGHRFFSKSDRVMQWWVDLMPPDVGDAGSETGGQTEISYQGKKRVVAVPAHLHEEPVLRGVGPILRHVDVDDVEQDEAVAAAVGRFTRDAWIPGPAQRSGGVVDVVVVAAGGMLRKPHSGLAFSETRGVAA